MWHTNLVLIHSKNLSLGPYSFANHIHYQDRSDAFDFFFPSRCYILHCVATTVLALLKMKTAALQLQRCPFEIDSQAKQCYPFFQLSQFKTRCSCVLRNLNCGLQFFFGYLTQKYAWVEFLIWARFDYQLYFLGEFYSNSMISPWKHWRMPIFDLDLGPSLGMEIPLHTQFCCSDGNSCWSDSSKGPPWHWQQPLREWPRKFLEFIPNLAPRILHDDIRIWHKRNDLT